MQIPIHRAILDATTQAKGIIAGLDGRFAALSTSPPIVPRGSSPGRLALAMVRQAAAPFDPAGAVMAVKTRTAERFKEIESRLEQVHEKAVALSELAGFVAGTGPVPEGAEPHLVAAATIVRRAADAGLYDARPLADQLQRDSLHALSGIRAAQADVEKQRLGAAVATARQSGLFWRRCARAATDPTIAEWFSRVASVAMGKHAARRKLYRARFGDGRVAAPPQPYRPLVRSSRGVKRGAIIEQVAK